MRGSGGWGEGSTYAYREKSDSKIKRLENSTCLPQDRLEGVQTQIALTLAGAPGQGMESNIPHYGQTCSQGANKIQDRVQPPNPIRRDAT